MRWDIAHGSIIYDRNLTNAQVKSGILIVEIFTARRLKYERQEFLKPSLRIVSGKSNPPKSISKGIMDSFRITSDSQHMVIIFYIIGPLNGDVFVCWPHVELAYPR